MSDWNPEDSQAAYHSLRRPSLFRTTQGGYMATIKIIEIIGSSEHGWEDAVHNAVKSAAKTLRQLVGADVQSWTAKIGPDSQITEYHATVKIAFKVVEGDEA